MTRRFDYTNERWRRLAHEIQGQRGCRCFICNCAEVSNCCHHTVPAGVYGDDYDYNPQYIEVLYRAHHRILHKEIFPHARTLYAYAREIKERLTTWDDIPNDHNQHDNVNWLLTYQNALELTRIWLETPKPWQMPKPPTAAMAKATEVWHSRVPYQFGLDLGIPAANDDQFKRRRGRRRG